MGTAIISAAAALFAVFLASVLSRTAYDSRKVSDADTVAQSARSVLHRSDIAFATMRIASPSAVVTAADCVRRQVYPHSRASHDGNEMDRSYAAAFEDADWCAVRTVARVDGPGFYAWICTVEGVRVSAREVEVTAR